MSEFSDLFGEWGIREDGTPKRLQVETFQGNAAWGDSFADPVPLSGLPVFRTTRLVRDTSGNQVASSTTIYVETELAHHFTTHSRVTLDDGAPTTVIRIDQPDTFGMFGFVVAYCE